jgi:hypothetical protein
VEEEVDWRWWLVVAAVVASGGRRRGKEELGLAHGIAYS